MLATAIAAVWLLLTGISIFSLADLEANQSRIFGDVEWVNRCEEIHVQLDDLHADAAAAGGSSAAVDQRILDRTRLSPDDIAQFTPDGATKWRELRDALDDPATPNKIAALNDARRIVRTEVRQVRSSLEIHARKMTAVWGVLTMLFIALLVGGAILGWVYTRALKRANVLEELREGADALSDSLRMEIREFRDAMAALERSETRLRVLAGRLQSAREDERAAISRELHDELGQSLTRLRFELALAYKACEDTGERERLLEMRSLVDSAIDGVRRAASQLRPPLLDTMGLRAALEWQVDEFSKNSDLICVKDIDDVDVDPDAAIALFRVVQEGLTNVTKHAEATRVVVRLYRDDDRVCVEVEDNGRGFDKRTQADPRSVGLVGMQERADALDGEFRIHGSDGGGTRIVFAVPVEAREEAA